MTLTTLNIPSKNGRPWQAVLGSSNYKEYVLPEEIHEISQAKSVCVTCPVISPACKALSREKSHVEYGSNCS